MRLLSAATNLADPRAISVTIGLAATGAAELVLVIDGLASRYTTVAAESAADAATNWAAQMATDFAAIPAFAATPAAGVISISAGADLFVQYWFSSDATQTVLVDSYADRGAYLRFDATAGTGLPAGPVAGVPLQRGFGPRTADPANAGLTVQVQLVNSSGGAKTADWTLWVFTPALGWAPHPDATSQTLSAGASDEVVTVRLALPTLGTRAAVALESTLANCFFSAWLAQ